MPSVLCGAILEKIGEQLERTVHLIAMIPADRCGWRPDVPGAWPVGMLLGHLLECCAGFCAVLAAVEPERLAHFAGLRSLPVNCDCAPAEAIERIGLYRDRIEEGFALLDDSRLGERVATVFVQEGEPLLTLLLGNLEHLINHKHQLFAYLQQMEVAVGTRDLYSLRGGV